MCIMFEMNKEALNRLTEELKKQNQLALLTLLLQIEKRLDEPDCLKIRARLSKRCAPLKLPELTNGMKAKEEAEVEQMSRIMDSYFAVLESFATLFKEGYLNKENIMTFSMSETLSDLRCHPELYAYIQCPETFYPNLAWLYRELEPKFSLKAMNLE